MKNQLFIYSFRLLILIPLSLVIIHQTGCIPNNDYSEELSGGYFYSEEGNNIKQILSYQPGNKEIYSKVINYNYNSNFIIILQTPIYDDYKEMIGFKLRENLKRYPNNSKEDLMKSENEADSILQHNAFYKAIFLHTINYWIIDNKNKIILGPLNKNEYMIKRKELGVPENLNLNN